jgi:pilus assembly protein CpaB
MNTKTWVPLAVAIVLGTAAAFMARRSLGVMAASHRPQTVGVVVAKGSIAPGHLLTSEDLSTSQLPGSVPPESGFTQPADLIGRVTAGPILPGQIFVQTLLAPRGIVPGLQALVPPGFRAVTVDVSESGSVAGLLAPGSRVDVVATALGRDNQDKTIARTIVQNVMVLAVGQRLTTTRGDNDKENSPAKTVTLLASPHDAEALDLAMTMSRVRLVLRSPNDTDEMVDDGVMLAELRGEDAFQPPAPVATAATTQPTAPASPVVPVVTQPDAFAKQPDQPSARIVRVILGAEERHVSFTDPQADFSQPAVTDADSRQPAIPQ